MAEQLRPPTPEEQEAVLRQERVTRRTFLMKVGLLLNGAVALIIATPVVRYLLSPVLGKPDYRSWVDLGGIDNFKEGDTVLVSFRNPFGHPWDGETQKTPAYVRRTGAQEFTVFAVNCAHLNCPVRWFAESQLFMCPCHGGVYYANGDRASGPPERGLFTYEYKISDGRLMIKAGQMPTLSNRAQLIREIAPCPGTSDSTRG
jgi:menaquinol-cytochrome c reductase iron-sulfur subunit